MGNIREDEEKVCEVNLILVETSVGFKQDLDIGGIYNVCPSIDCRITER